jgi:hypothetical protein
MALRLAYGVIGLVGTHTNCTQVLRDRPGLFMWTSRLAVIDSRNLFGVKRRGTHSAKIVTDCEQTGRVAVEATGDPMSDRKTIAITVFIAGIMLGAFTVELKDQLSLHFGTLGLNAIMKCSATGP